MLTKPDSGWSDFQLDGTYEYGLSYLDDIAFDWLDHAIHGLETMQPFCVKGNMEPGHFLCVVSYYNCHIICENDDNRLLSKEDISTDYSHTSMIDFCKFLYNNIHEYIEEWTTFVAYGECDFDEHRKELENKLERLKNLITEKEEDFNKYLWL